MFERSYLWMYKIFWIKIWGFVLLLLISQKGARSKWPPQFLVLVYLFEILRVSSSSHCRFKKTFSYMILGWEQKVISILIAKGLLPLYCLKPKILLNYNFCLKNQLRVKIWVKASKIWRFENWKIYFDFLVHYSHLQPHCSTRQHNKILAPNNACAWVTNASNKAKSSR